MGIKSLSLVLAAPVTLAVVASCGTEVATAPPKREAIASTSGIQMLFEAECLKWQSFAWAKTKYMQERAACAADITERSVQDCQANVTGVEWQVDASNSPVKFEISYFFDEVERPDTDQTFCEVSVPSKFAREGLEAAQAVASKYRLRGPYQSGQNGFSRPTLQEYWLSEKNVPTIGVFSIVSLHENKAPGINISRFSGRTEAVETKRH